MTKRFWAVTIKRILISLVVVFLAGVVFDRAFNTPIDRSPFLAGFMAVGLYLAFSLTVSLLEAISGALYLWVFGGKDVTAGVLDDLRATKLLAPRRYDPKSYDYLAILADDESAPVADRVKAAALHGAYSVHLSKGLFRSLALQKGIDDAILRYSQEAPQRPEPDDY